MFLLLGAHHAVSMQSVCVYVLLLCQTRAIMVQEVAIKVNCSAYLWGSSNE